MSAHLFVYGTLHPSLAPPSIAATVRALRLVGAATIRGSKLDIGDYPGLVLGPDAQEEVHGMLFALPDDATTLAALDAYEDFRPDDPDGSLFLRVKHAVTRSDGGEIVCWVYVYNRLPTKEKRAPSPV